MENVFELDPLVKRPLIKLDDIFVVVLLCLIPEPLFLFGQSELMFCRNLVLI